MIEIKKAKKLFEGIENESAEFDAGDILTLKPSTVAVITKDEPAEIMKKVVDGENLQALMIKNGEDLITFFKLGREKTGFEGYLQPGVYGKVKIGGTIKIEDDAEVVADIKDAKFSKYSEAPVWVSRVYGSASDEYKIADLSQDYDDYDMTVCLTDHIKRLDDQERQGKYREAYIREAVKITCKYVIKSKIDIDKAFELYEQKKAASVDYICRDEKGRFLHDKLAEYMVEHDHVCRVMMDGGDLVIPYIYMNDGDMAGTYQDDIDIFERKMLSYIPGLTDKQRSEVYKTLRLIAPLCSDTSEGKIVCGNGVLDVETRELSEFSPDIFATAKIPWNWNPGAYSERIDDFLHRFTDGDDKLKRLILAELGYMLYPKNFIRKSVPYFISPPGYGKSTLFRIVTMLVGRSKCATLDLENFERDIFASAALIGKSGLIVDDTTTGSQGFVGDTSILKKIVTGEPIPIRRAMNNKGGGWFDVVPKCKMWISSQVPKKFKDDGGGFLDRLIPIRCTHNFKKDPDCDQTFESKIDEHDMEYVLLCAVISLQQLLLTQKFPIPDQSEVILSTITEMADPILAFCDEYDYKNPEDIEGRFTNEVYDEFKEYCCDVLGKDEGNVMQSAQFTTQIKIRFGLDRSKHRERYGNGDRGYRYVKIL